MKDFLLFKSFVAHTLVKIFFYLAMGILFIGYFGVTATMFFTEGIVAGLGTGVLGFIAVVFYAIFIRVMSEMMIVTFQIHDELKQMNSKM